MRHVVVLRRNSEIFEIDTIQKGKNQHGWEYSSWDGEGAGWLFNHTNTTIHAHFLAAIGTVYMCECNLDHSVKDLEKNDACVCSSMDVFRFF